jgi:hypothetical protein
LIAERGIAKPHADANSAPTRGAGSSTLPELIHIAVDHSSGEWFGNQPKSWQSPVPAAEAARHGRIAAFEALNEAETKLKRV